MTDKLLREAAQNILNGVEIASNNLRPVGMPTTT
jgi:hypothetical protein